MKRILKALVVLFLVAAALSAIQRLSVDPYLYAELKKDYASLQPVHMRFKIVDQFGNPATNFKFKIRARGIRWFYWLYPEWSHAMYKKTLVTDEHGEATFNLKFTKVFAFRLNEDDSSAGNGYQFPRSAKLSPAKCLQDNPIALFPMPSLHNGIQRFSLQVFKHHWPKKTITFNPFEDSGGLIKIEAADKVHLTLNFKKNSYSFSKAEGDLSITVFDAKRVGQAWWNHYFHGASFDSKTRWEVLVEGLGGTILQPAGGNLPTQDIQCDAPLQGYHRGVDYLIDFGKGRGYGFPWITPIDESPGPDIARFSFNGKSALLQTFFVRQGESQLYGRVKIAVELRSENGSNVDIIFRSSGYFNADGSRNL